MIIKIFLKNEILLEDGVSPVYICDENNYREFSFAAPKIMIKEMLKKNIKNKIFGMWRVQIE